MNVYIDSSVLLRVLLGEPGRLEAWGRVEVGVASELIRLECLRTIDRARIQMRLPDTAVADRRAAALDAIEGLDIVPLTTPVLERAAEPFPTSIGSLDAVHLASALLVRDRYDALTFATHDEALATAARAMGFTVQGV